MSQTISFNADDRQKILVEVLAKRLGFKNVSDMLRGWIEDGITEQITEQEQAQILSFYKPRAESSKRPKAARTR